jgi:hypothetical protein
MGPAPPVLLLGNASARRAWQGESPAANQEALRPGRGPRAAALPVLLEAEC